MDETYDPTHFPCMPVMMKAQPSSHATDMPLDLNADSSVAQLHNLDAPAPMEIDPIEPAGTTTMPCLEQPYKLPHQTRV